MSLTGGTDFGRGKLMRDHRYITKSRFERNGDPSASTVIPRLDPMSLTGGTDFGRGKLMRDHRYITKSRFERNGDPSASTVIPRLDRGIQ